ncbi:6-phosphofructo-2-kinase-domain-containing protein [Halteromyces radiatus]|uniref:6-phosphofructo-2-kinase-domain-containing protein n=1 Tax=Halteromyces radiatus TaxID=101107 RepID=UPI00221EC8CE|nr:6-phosphofructo-2-kinase-domain-containing protein [Halteromyces radiatus]KAI8081720.1 6-phosphofructo-2-kinase-domain-containing protein [Halteromyces radiatus]
MDRRRRKTLPVVKTDHDIEHPEDELYTMTEEPEEEYQQQQPLPPPPPAATTTPQGHWVKLAEDDNTSYLFRHSIGLEEIPGVVQTLKPPKNAKERPLDSKLAIIMVGLPARGKSYIVKKLRRYLNWLQYETRVFNVGNTRRDQRTADMDQSASFFDPDNKDMKRMRDELAMNVLEQLIDWLKSGHRSSVAIHDATNSTIDRRKLLIDRLRKEPSIKILLMESVCTDQKVLERNFRLKLLGPDYKDKDPCKALADFRSRVANYERAYEPLGDWEEERDLQYCKMINVGKKVVAYNISGYLAGQCIFYLMNFNLSERQIFVTRHGQSTDNLEDRIGGDASLTPLGRKFGKALEKFIGEQRKSFAIDLAKSKYEQEQKWESYGLDSLDLTDGSKDKDKETTHDIINSQAEAISSSQFTIWTSMLKRSTETAETFNVEDYDIKHIRFLNEINSGDRERMTYEEIKQQYPDEFKARQENKLYYRYPGMGGESYIDVIHRLQPLIIELERMTQSCLIITHRVVLRIILGYLLDWSREEMPHMLVPLHTVYELRPKPYGSQLKKWKYVEEKDTFEEF